MKDAFSRFHPLASFGYFTAVLLFSMFVMNPFFSAISLINAVVYSVYLNGRRSVRFGLLYLIPAMLMLIIINPLFNHEGMTAAAYLPSGNPITVESIIYGCAAALLMAGVVMWFSCFNTIITSDKLMYLFGRIVPHLSLMLSMSLRFIPRFRNQFTRVREAQRCIGRDISGGIIKRLKNAVKIFSIMVTWSLENSVETADSMKSRGYGTSKRTSYSVYKFEKRDALVLLITALLSAFVIYGCASGYVNFRYFPTVKGSGTTPLALGVYTAYFLLCAMPMAINLKEETAWRCSRSRI